MTKLKMHSPDIVKANVAKLAELFPSCVTETQDEQGNISRAVDFELLQQELSDKLVDGTRERYHLDWPGKRESLLTANSPIAKTLRPDAGRSVDFDTTRNLFIEGDNLDALKLLQESFLNKVKLIYIDPPYNTGRDFVYDDDFQSSASAYLLHSEQADAEGNRLVANPTSNGRFHSNWLSMMYSRLRLARNLLTDDGALFISIDDGEQANLKRICDEIFGESNFIADAIWRSKDNSNNDAQRFSTDHNHTLIYAKSANWQPARIFDDSKRTHFKNPDNDPKGAYFDGNPLRVRPTTHLSFRQQMTQQASSRNASWTSRRRSYRVRNRRNCLSHAIDRSTGHRSRPSPPAVPRPRSGKSGQTPRACNAAARAAEW